MNTHKRCKKCLEMKPVSAFYRDRTRPDGLKAQCKACQDTQKAEYRERLHQQELYRERRAFEETWGKAASISVDEDPGEDDEDLEQLDLL